MRLASCICVCCFAQALADSAISYFSEGPASSGAGGIPACCGVNEVLGLAVLQAEKVCAL